MPLSTAWQRFSVSGTLANGLTKVYLQIGDSTSFPSGETVYVWGAEMVMGSTEGAPIETTNTTTSDVNGATVYLAANGMNQSYSYDPFGNMVSAGNFNFQQAYTTANQLVGWAYDASGDVVNNGLGQTFTYDAEGRISAVSGYTYVYSPEGERVSKQGSGDTDYIYFAGREVARLTGGQWTDLIYGVSGLLAEVPGTQAGSPVYRMVDHLGTVVGTLNSSGVQLSSSDYAPFGQLFAGGTTDPYQFTGKERDAETGNDYFGARYYASSMGRFMSPDWSAKVEPVPYSKMDDPQSLNLYAYVYNNPLAGVDPDGHSMQTGKGQFIPCAGENDSPGQCRTSASTFAWADLTTSFIKAGLLSSGAQQQGTVPVVVGQRPIQNKWAQFFSELFTFHKAYHSYYRLTGDDGVTHQFEVLGNPGSSKNQQVRDTYDPTGGGRMSHGTEHTVYATEAQAAALINRSEYFESQPCPVCTNGQEGYNLVFHNSNSFVYNMLSGAPGGGIPPPSAPTITPGYAKRPDDWY